MALVELSRGKCALVDDADVPLLSGKRWHAQPSSTGKYYAAYRGSVKPVYMHRLITSCPDGLEVDHINHDTLDNRRSNLRVVTHAENMRNGKFALATHCPRGHAYDGTNTYRDSSGRRCKSCAAERQSRLRASETSEQREARLAYMREYYAKKRAA
jgi:hypothetical protein